MGIETAQIYRVEDRCGLGPYICGDWHRWQDPNKSQVEERLKPACSRDEIKRLLKHREAVFGFVTMKQLHEWFSESELSKLHALGYEIAHVKVECIIGKSSQFVLAVRSIFN